MHDTRCHLHLTLKNFFSGKLSGILMAKGRLTGDPYAPSIITNDKKEGEISWYELY